MNRTDPDRLLLRRARRNLAVQNIVAIAVILLIVGAVVFVAVSRQQRAALTRSLRQTAVTEEDVVDPPAGSWIFQIDAGDGLSATDDPPAGFPDRGALERVRAGGPPELSSQRIRGTDYLIVTRQRGSRTVQVVGSLAGQESENRRLLAALGAAELLGLLAAGLTGFLLARHATAPLGEALARQRRFVADASHELRTPLTQLHTRAQLLSRDLRAGATPPEMSADVEHLVAGTGQLRELVEDLLLATQAQGGAEAVEEVDLGVVAAGVVTSFGERARALDIAVELQPDPDRPSVIRGRAAAMRRVLTALVDNALSHTPPGGSVTVQLASPTPRQVTLVVRDTGGGFDPADSEQIFARFARGHDDHRRFGLGLALAREVITGHGGTIVARGFPGQGAEFTVQLPSA